MRCAAASVSVQSEDSTEECHTGTLVHVVDFHLTESNNSHSTAEHCTGTLIQVRSYRYARTRGGLPPDRQTIHTVQ